MCALRTVNTGPALAYNYRMNMKSPKGVVTTIVKHGKPLDEIASSCTSLPSIIISESTPRDDIRRKTICEDFDEWLEYDSEDELDNSTIIHVDPSIKVYDAICKQNKCVPISSVKTGLVSKKLSCKFVKLESNELNSVCTALCVSCHVEHIEFEQNDIGAKGAKMLREVIQNGTYLTKITIKGNNLKSEGAHQICKAVMENTKISYLDLSGNGFVEKDGILLSVLIEKCHHLRKLYLGNNCLREEGIKHIAAALAKSCSLIALDLNWNHIRMEGAKSIGEALKTNSGLEKLNLSWNGLHEMGAEAIAEGLRENDTLEELDLTCNRLTEQCIAAIMRGLDQNSTLHTLRIGKNHVTTKGAFTILQHLKRNTESGIALLDLGRQEVEERFEDLYEELMLERNVKVRYGMVWRCDSRSLSNSSYEDEVALLSCNPLTVLMECMRLQNFRLVDFFKSLDTNKSNLICISELAEGLSKLSIPINRKTLSKLLTRLDKDGNRQLDFAEMIAAQRQYKQQWREAMNGNIDFNKTDIGRVTLHLRRIMGKGYVMKKKENDTLALASADRSANRSANRSRVTSAKIREFSEKIYLNQDNL